jgi:maltose O-acetyltransferase
VNAFRNKKVEKYLATLKKNGLRIGNNVTLLDNIFFDSSHCFLISIGDNCIICPNVRLIAHDASTKYFLGFTKIGKIEILDNCFIGDSSIILPGVTIGPNTIVGAGSLVTHTLPPNVVAVGNPARVLSTVEEYIKKITSLGEHKKIFSEEYYIDKLTDEKRKELMEAIGNTIGFIV